MSTSVTGPGEGHASPSIASFPQEIKDKILFHLLVDPEGVTRIETDPLTNAINLFLNWVSYNPVFQQKLEIIALIPGAGEIFWRYSTFSIHHGYLEAFVDCRFPAMNGGEINRSPTPKDHIRSVKLRFQLGGEKRRSGYNPAPAWRRLLECPKLEKVDFAVRGRWDKDFVSRNRLFSNVAGVCMELGERLGEEGFKMRFEFGFSWTIADFKSGIMPATDWERYWLEEYESSLTYGAI